MDMNMARKLAESEQRYRSLIEHNLAGIVTCDMQGHILSMNQAMERILGYTEQELTGRSIQELAVIDSSAESPVTSDSLLKQTDNFMLRAQHKNGEWIELGVKNVPIIVDSGQEGVYLIARDITQLNREREERMHMEKELRETKELLESLITHTTDAICMMDTQGCVISVNKAHEQIFGWSFEELLHKPLPIYPAFLEEQRTEMYDMLRAGKQITGLESVRLRKDGQVIHVSVTKTPIRNAQGDIIGFSAITRDITERKQTEELLRKSDKLAVAGQLAAGLAHEIRNPLTSLRGFLQLLQHDMKDKKHYFDIMLSELDRINFIVSEFLVIAKPEAIQYKKGNLTSILHSVTALLETQAVLGGAVLTLDFEEDIPDIVCSEMHLKQLFINLVKNALEAISKDGRVHITVSMAGPDLIRVRTEDNGCGIPEERVKQLGEPFYTTKEKGTGLGLMMCFKIVEAHRGQLHIESTVGHGTTIDVLLPVTE
ncbi:PAS domain S-box protein [Paenibacillus oryzisoli]|uniref:PAS domain-containing sensor histidine kinase n=1 Tax=Paenibacillus oryzisoli TaxID=1850517 RepID=UPI003D2D7BFC